MNSSLDNIISISLDRQAEKVRQVRAANDPQASETGQGFSGRAALALATTGVVVATLVLAFAIR
jgi:hypothetical protein